MTAETSRGDETPDEKEDADRHTAGQVAQLEGIPPEVRELLESKPPETVEKIVGFFQKTYFTGPLPPPEVVKGYAEILPDGPERIISGWEAQY